MGKLRFMIALWAARLSIPALKLTHHNGTDFPGSLAVKICPDFLRYIGKPQKILAITGTNGKTTVANLLIDILEKEGVRLISNRAGSNILSGICTTLISGCDLFGRAKDYDLAVLEVDERYSPRIYEYVKPDDIVVTNLFRDSLTRNAHPGYIASILTDAFPKTAHLILNADDLISCGVAPENPRVYFGIDHMPGDASVCENLVNDVQVCPRCGEKMHYAYFRYHHIGRSSCPACGYGNPVPDYQGVEIDLQNRTMLVAENGEKHPYHLISDSPHNIYNMVTVIAALRQMGYSHAAIARHMETAQILASRVSEEKIGDVTVVVQMSKEKNALANSRNFDHIRKAPGKKEVFLMMNCLNLLKDWSENPSWMYDADFEFLHQDDITTIVCAGSRCLDYKLRLLLAGVPEDRIRVEKDEFKALELLPCVPGDRIYILHGVDSVARSFRVKERLRKMLTKEDQ